MSEQGEKFKQADSLREKRECHGRNHRGPFTETDLGAVGQFKCENCGNAIFVE